MDRRHFLKKSAAAGAALAVSGTIERLAAAALATGPVDLAVASGDSPEKITRAAVEALGGINTFIARGDVVVIKPNIAWDRVPEQAGNTNPTVVATMVRMCLEAGAGKVKVFDRTVNDPRRCYVQSGIEQAAKKAGADVSHIDERKFREMAINGVALKEWPLYTEVFEADKVINIPIAKHHGLARLTMATKNWMGIMGGSRNKIHQRLDESVVDVAMFVKPTLTVLDAVRVLTANGPQGGDLADVKAMNTVVAGVDQTAIDAYGATLFGLQGRDLGYVAHAAAIGKGVMDLDMLNIRHLNV